MSDKGSYENRDEWLEEFDHEFCYDLTETSNDQSHAADNVQVLTYFKFTININKALVLACRNIDRGRAAHCKIASILNLQQPFGCTYWRKHTQNFKAERKLLQ